MRAAGFLRGVFSSWFALFVAVAAQILQVRWARGALPDAEFALFNMISNLVTAFLVTEIGVRPAFARLLLDARARDDEACGRLWSTAYCVFAVQSLLMLAMGLAVLPWVPGWFGAPPELTGTVRAVFACMVLVTSLQYAVASHQVALIATQRFVLVNAVAGLATIVSFVVFCAGLKAGAGMWSYVWSGLVGLLVTGVGVVMGTKVSGVSQPFVWKLVSWAEVKRIFGLGLDLFFVGLHLIFLSQSVLIFAGAHMSLAAVGVLVVNLKFVQFAVQVCQRIPGTAEPVLAGMVAENDFDRFRRTWGLTVKAAMLVTLLVAGGLYLWMPLLVTKLTSSADIMTGPALALLMLIPVRYMAHLVFVLPSQIFKAANRLRWALGAELAICALLMSVCGKWWGIEGLLAAHFGSVALGSFWKGTSVFAELSGLSRQEIWRVVWVSSIVPIMIFAGLACFCPAPETLELGRRVAFSAGWMLALALWMAIGGLTASEKQMVLRKLRRNSMNPASS